MTAMEDSSLDSAVAANLASAAKWICEADALVVAAGAGMGVDSGLPDFRGDTGFWKAYPPYARLGLKFMQLADPRWFRDDPTLAWGFYGHRMNLYRATMPHGGFDILKRWIGTKPNGGFVFTSNVDGHFQKAGFDSDRIVEVHGSGHWMQCSAGCGVGIFPADDAIHYPVIVDESTMRAAQPLPACPSCGKLVRPNILMFGDWDWLANRSAAQERSLRNWLWNITDGNLVVVECGAGTAVPTVRLFSEECVRDHNARLIRFNLREPQVPAGQIGLPLGAKAAIEAIDRESRGTQ